jgi:hypothetical protein
MDVQDSGIQCSLTFVTVVVEGTDVSIAWVESVVACILGVKLTIW